MAQTARLSPEFDFVVKGSGSVATDAARLAEQVAALKAKGGGRLLFDGSSAPGWVLQAPLVNYTLSVNGSPTASLSPTATASAVQTALTNLSGSGTFTVLGGPGRYIINTAGSLDGQAVTLTMTPSSGTSGRLYRGGIFHLSTSAVFLHTDNLKFLEIDATPDTRIIRHNSSSNIQVGASHNPFTMAGSGTMNSMAAGSSTIVNPTITLTPGMWVCLSSTNVITEASTHSAPQPQLPCEFHRVSKQLLQSQARAWTFTAPTSGSGTLTLNGVATTSISYPTSSGTLQTALQTVGGAGNITVSGTSPNFSITAVAGPLMSQQNTLTASAGTVDIITGSSVIVPINSWYLEDPIYDPMTTGMGIVPIPTISGVQIRNINMEMLPGVIPAGNSIFLGGCVDFVMENCRLGSEDNRMNPGSADCLMSKGVMSNVIVCDQENYDRDSDLYYGMLDTVCNGIIRTNCRFGATRHGFSTASRARVIGPTTHRAGCSLNGIFNACIFACPTKNRTDTAAVWSQPMLDFHPEAARYTITDCRFYVPPFQKALNIRSRDITITRCHFDMDNSSSIGHLRAKNITFSHNEIVGGYALSVDNPGTQPNIDNIKITKNTFKKCIAAPILIFTGTGIEIDDNEFYECSGTAVSSPWTPRAMIYVASLTNNTTARIRITKNRCFKGTNDFFLYASGLSKDQLFYADNMIGGFSNTGIGIARNRIQIGSPVPINDPNGAPGPITVVPEWEMLYGYRNGQQKLKYVNLTGHGLTTDELWHPIDKDGAVYDDTDDLAAVDGILADVINDNWYVLYPLGSTFEMPATMLGGTYSMGADPRDIYWDASNAGGTYVNNQPGGSVGPPMIRINWKGATEMQVTVLGQSSSSGGGSFGETDLGTFGQDFIAAETSADAMALFSTTPATFPNVTTPPFVITDAVGVPINPNNGGIQTWTITANRTPSLASFATGQRVLLHVSRSGSFTVTWTGVVWVGGAAPTIPASGARVVELWRIGSTVYGYSYGDVA